jgi:hypothetical protein
MERDPELIYYWRKELQDVEIQAYLDAWAKYLHLDYPRMAWLLMLDEKLTRAEQEVNK